MLFDRLLAWTWSLRLARIDSGKIPSDRPRLPFEVSLQSASPKDIGLLDLLPSPA